MSQIQKRVTLQLIGKKRSYYPTDNSEYYFSVKVVDTKLIGQPRELSKTEKYKFLVGMTYELTINWNLYDNTEEANLIDIIKILFEHCREFVDDKLRQGLTLEENCLLLTTENSPRYCPYDISRIPDPNLPLSFFVEEDINRTYKQDIEIFVDDIDSFEKVRNIRSQDVKPLLPVNLSEENIQTFLEEIIGENFHQEDWGGEINDLYTSNIQIDGKRNRAAFLLKGNGTKGKLTIAKCGRNGDQIIRLFESPSDIFFIQHVGEIDQYVVSDFKNKALLKVSKGEKCQICILDGTETARILKAYGKI